MCGRNTQSLSGRKPSAATQINYIQLAANRCVATTVQFHRDSKIKIMTWNPRKPPNQRSCFLFRIEGYEWFGKLFRLLAEGAHLRFDKLRLYPHCVLGVFGSAQWRG
jgi:hypothetical protein